MTDINQFSFTLANGNTQSMNDYSGKVLLLVNTASKCGFTPQLEGLEELHQRFGEQGLVVLGFPCNQFGSQDPGTMAEITEFCQLNYGVSFPLAAKSDVNGENALPLFEYVKSKAPGLMGSTKIKWNFTKFLVNRKGQVIKRFAPTTKPKDMAKAIDALLANG